MSEGCTERFQNSLKDCCIRWSPVIGAQIDNEYMHSSAPWELTTGISNEWVFGGDEGETYMLTLLDEAKKCGIETPFLYLYGLGRRGYSFCNDAFMGGYAYRPWLFYTRRGEHPCTEEYIYQDYHNAQRKLPVISSLPMIRRQDPMPAVKWEEGMMCSYNYRFILPYKSVDRHGNIKIASGCNFLGYYVFQGEPILWENTGDFSMSRRYPRCPMIIRLLWGSSDRSGSLTCG